MNPQIGFLLNRSLESLRNSSLESAELYLKQAMRLQSNNPHVLRLLGVIYAQRKQYSEALNYLKASIKYLPKNALALSNLGNVFLELKDHQNALDAYDKSIKIDPMYAEAWSNKGNALYELKRYDEAIAHHDRAVSLNPSYAQAWSNKGNALHELKRYDEAIAHHDQALSLKTDYAEAWSNKGNALLELKRYDEAIAHYERAISFKSEIDWIDGKLLHTRMNVCSWSGFENSLENINKSIWANKKATSPFPLLALKDDALLHKKASEIYTQNRHPFNFSLGLIPEQSENQKIRIGYFSADFNQHAVAVLTAELFELHDKEKFEIFAFSFGVDDKSSMRLRLSRAFNQFIDVSEMSDVEIATLSRELRIDIAIDLGGHTANSCTDIFAYRAAPIQVSYIGYLGTMGADYIDYLIADKTIVPEGSEEFYSEKIAYLPSYQVNDRKRVVSDRLFTRQELGLPDKGFVFCCFNNSYKITPSVFDGWMRILSAVEGSVLFLYAENHWAEGNLKKEALARGIDSSRLIFARRIPIDEYLARYRACDLFLDTFPYNAGTTASDALWVGLPVLTLTGQSFASRMAASLLNAIDLPGLIVDTQEKYEALAIELAMNPEKLSNIKQTLVDNRLITRLFDTPSFTKNLESMYVKMYERNLKGLLPDCININ